MMWAAGILAALGSITYPAISAFVSIHSTADSQGKLVVLLYIYRQVPQKNIIAIAIE